MLLKLSFISLIILLLSIRPFAQTDATRTVIHPLDNQAGLNNPDMGWYYYKYDDGLNAYGTRTANDNVFPEWMGMNTIYYRIPWGKLEPQKDQINWSLIDSTAKYWIAAGKKIAFRIPALEGNAGATPVWANGGVYDPANADWILAYESFLSQFAARYDGKEFVAYIDIGSIGIWGEGHGPYSDSIKIRHLDMHLKYFHKTLLVVNDDLGQAVCNYARTKGMTLRDDSVLFSDCNSTKVSYEPFWPLAPTIIETDHYGTIKNGGNPWGKGWSDQCVIDVIEKYHASYLSVHGWPDDFFKERQAFIAKANLRIGYRLQMTEASWPQSLGAGIKSANVVIKWRNAGAAPCYKGGYPILHFKNAGVNFGFDLIDSSFNVNSLAPGDTVSFGKVVVDSTLVRFPSSAPSGTYDVAVSVGTKSGEALYLLPYAGDDVKRTYPLGSIDFVSTNKILSRKSSRASPVEPVWRKSYRLNGQKNRKVAH